MPNRARILLPFFLFCGLCLTAQDVVVYPQLGHSPVTSVAFSPDGRQVLSGSWDRTVRLWDAATGQEIRTFVGHKDNVSSVAFSPDGRQVLSGSDDKTVRLWDAATGREIRTFAGHTGWVFSVAFSPDGRQVLSGSHDNTVRLWDAVTGREIRTFAGHTSRVTSVAFSPDGRQALSGSLDGTVRLWDTATCREIAQFVGFGFRDGEWVVITPDGYYNASPNGDKYLNVRVGNNVFGIDQYRAMFYNPQIVEARLAGRLDPVRVATTIQEAAPPPQVTILSPANGAGLTAGQVELSVSVVDQRQPVKSVKVLVNGRLVGGDEMKAVTGSRGLVVENTALIVSGNENRVEFRFPVTLDAGVNRIEVLASNAYSEGRGGVEVTYRQPAPPALPNLWILSVGVNRYNDSRLPNLNYAVNDARAIVDVFKAQQGRLYNRVNTLLIADGESVAPTRDNIIRNFAFLKQAGQRDVALLFIAGHGLNDDGGNFYFMPSDAAFNADGSIRPASAVSSREIQSVLDMPGQKLVFIDACHSEGSSDRRTRSADNNHLVRSLQDASTVILTSSRGSQLSLESREYGHGIFTYAILQGMRGEADFMRKGTVTIKELDAYVSLKVPEMTGGRQQPTTSTPDGYVNFVVADIK